MSGNGLPVIEARSRSEREEYEEKTRARCARYWREREEICAQDRERIRRTQNLISRLPLEGKEIADLGCGNSPFTLEGARVTSVDAAESLAEHAKIACLPYVRLPEEHYDGVLLTDVIAEIEPHLYRLLLSEIAALMKREAFFLCSTELDLRSEDPLGYLLSLITTEFDVIEMRKSYHRLYTYLRALLDAPSHFVRAARENTYRLAQIEEREGILRLWFYLNSLKWIALFWRPLISLKKRLHNRRLLLTLEKVSEILFGEGALTHVILLCKRKTLHPHQ